MIEFLLTVDDLRAMQRSVGIWLPGFAVNGDGIGLRGELELEEVIRVAQAYTDAVLAVEVLADRAGTVTEYAYSVSACGERSLMEALPRGLVRCTLPEDDPVTVVAAIAGLSREFTPADGLMWTVSADAYQRCDSLALAGDEEGAVAALTRARITERTAKAWVAALCGRGSAAAITVVRREPESGRLEAGELRFVADSQGGAWRITSDQAGYTITPLNGTGLLAALGELMRQRLREGCLS